MEEAVRLREANRKQLILHPTDLDGLLEAEHPARAIWRVLEGLELGRFEESIKAREGSAGRDATDPKILLGLWLYGLSQGVSSARELARLSMLHAAYRWICGGVTVNYHMLSEFRSAQSAALDELMSQVLAVLMHKGLVKLYRVAQDGTRVRANAGKASFHRRRTLEGCLQEARAQVAALAQEVQRELPQASARVVAARRRAAREREQRVAQALSELEQLSAARAQARNHSQRQREARASTTDPQARVMKLADGGFAPAYNLQFATDTESRLIVGVGATNAGNDSQQLEPMQDQLQRRAASRCFRRCARTATSISIRCCRSRATARHSPPIGCAWPRPRARRSIRSVWPPPRPSTPISRPGAAWTACCCAASARC